MYMYSIKLDKNHKILVQDFTDIWFITRRLTSYRLFAPTILLLLYQKWGNRCESQSGIHELRILHGLRELRGPDGAHQPDALHARNRARLHAANGWQHWSRLYVPVPTARVSARIGKCSGYQATRANPTWRLWFIKVHLNDIFASFKKLFFFPNLGYKLRGCNQWRRRKHILYKYIYIYIHLFISYINHCLIYVLLLNHVWK